MFRQRTSRSVDNNASKYMVLPITPRCHNSNNFNVAFNSVIICVYKLNSKHSYNIDCARNQYGDWLTVALLVCGIVVQRPNITLSISISNYHCTNTRC